MMIEKRPYRVNPFHNLASGLRGLWLPNTLTGGSSWVNDISPYGHHARLRGFANKARTLLRHEGRFCWETVGNQIEDYLDLPHQTVDGLAETTYACWVKPIQTSTMAFFSGANSGSNNEQLLFYDGSQLAWYDNGSKYTLGVGINTSKWTLYTVVRNNSGVRFFVDGRLQSSPSFSKATPDIDPNGLVFGQEQDSVGGSFDSGQCFVGYFDFISIWGRNLTDSEVLQLFEETRDGGYGKLVLFAPHSSITNTVPTYGNQTSDPNQTLWWFFQAAYSPTVSLTVDSCSHSHTSDQETITTVSSLVPADVAHAHTETEPTISEAADLTIANVSHTHTETSAGIETVSSLVVDGSAHTHTVSTPTISTESTLAVDDQAHTHSETNVSLGTVSSLVVDGVSHTHTESVVSVATGSSLTIADCQHTHTEATTALTTESTLVISGQEHAHSSDQAELQSTVDLVLANVSHSHTESSPSISTSSSLVISNHSHVHTVAVVSLESISSLVVDNHTHAHRSSGSLLESIVSLAIETARHIHSSPSATVYLPATVAGVDAEYKSPTRRLHFGLGVNKTHYKAPVERTHFRPDVNRTHFEVPNKPTFFRAET